MCTRVGGLLPKEKFYNFNQNLRTRKTEMQIALSRIAESSWGHTPFILVNTKEGLGLIRHFLEKPGTNGVVNICGKAVNRGVGLGMKIPCEYFHWTTQTH